MNSAAQNFANYLSSKEIKYRLESENVLSTGFTESNTSVTVKFVFGEDGEDVALRVFSIAKVPENKLAGMAQVCSQLNLKYRWVRFYLDSDNEVTAAIDAVISAGTSNDVCFELLIRIIKIVNEAYPEIMKGLWS